MATTSGSQNLERRRKNKYEERRKWWWRRPLTCNHQSFSIASKRVFQEPGQHRIPIRNEGEFGSLPLSFGRISVGDCGVGLRVGGAGGGAVEGEVGAQGRHCHRGS